MSRQVGRVDVAIAVGRLERLVTLLLEEPTRIEAEANEQTLRLGLPPVAMYPTIVTKMRRLVATTIAEIQASLKSLS